MCAIDKIFELLLDYGLSESIINELLAQFLEEEAIDYIEYMELNGVTKSDLKTNVAKA